MNQSIFKSIGAIAAGFIAGFVLSVGTDVVLNKAGILNEQAFGTSPVWLILILISYRSVYNVLGCYLAARLAPSRPMRHALIIGVIGFVFCAIGLIVMWAQPPHWYPISLLVLTLPCAWLGGTLASASLKTQLTA